MKVFTWLDALYFVSVTLATVGYGVSAFFLLLLFSPLWFVFGSLLFFLLFSFSSLGRTVWG